MVAWSSVGLKNIAKLNLSRSVIGSFRNPLNNNTINYIPIRCGHGHEKTILIHTSRYSWKKFKDLLNFYLLLGIIPIASLITYTNVFIGDATLAEIPKGYEPKHWEYHRHPITRFFARYLIPSPQEDYERALHNVFVSAEKTEVRRLENKVRDLMSDRQDYQSWYFIPPAVKYGRKTFEIVEEAEFSRKGLGPSTVF